MQNSSPAASCVSSGNGIRPFCFLRLTFLIATLSLCAASHGIAADRTFPYIATIDVDAEPVRSGPGPRYDVTSDLPRGSQVTVHRHDPGGWVMIAPPTGSFSWIAAEDIELDPADAARLNEAQPVSGKVSARTALVYVGSELNLSRQVVQRRLTTGDNVQILGEAMLPAGNRALRYFKISPPTHEYRWITARALRPETDRSISQGSPSGPSSSTTASASHMTGTSSTPAATSANPFSLEIPPLSSETSSTEASDSVPLASTSTSREESAAPPAFPVASAVEPAPLPEISRAEVTPRTRREHLTQIDQQLRTMVTQTPDRWDLTRIEQQYRQLAADTTDETFQYVVDQRIHSLSRYQKIYSDYQDFDRIFREAREKDAALQAQAAVNRAALQQAPNTPPLRNAPPGTAYPRPIAQQPPRQLAASAPHLAPSNSMVPPGSAIQPMNHQVPANPQPTGPQATSAITPANAQNMTASVPIRATARPASQGASIPNFDGAGVLKKVQPRPIDFPPLAITTTDGKLLAYVEASDELMIQLADQIGKPVGLKGVRAFEDRFSTDVIKAQSWQPVILQNAPLAGSPRR